MKKYLLIGIDKGCVDCIYFLGQYYLNINKYKKMKKYLLMGIDAGHTESMCFLARYYIHIEKYKKMKKYLLMAIEKGHAESMWFLGEYYFLNKKFKKMKKYFLMTLDIKDPGNNINYQGDDDNVHQINACFNLARYYDNYYINNENKIKNKDKHKKMIYYYSLAANKGCQKSMNNLGVYYFKIANYKKMKKYCLMALHSVDIKFKEVLNNIFAYYENQKIMLNIHI